MCTDESKINDKFDGSKVYFIILTLELQNIDTILNWCRYFVLFVLENSYDMNNETVTFQTA